MIVVSVGEVSVVLRVGRFDPLVLKSFTGPLVAGSEFIGYFKPV